MPTVVPESDGGHGKNFLARSLAEALDALLECTGATEGWVQLIEDTGRLEVPAVRGKLAPAWFANPKGNPLANWAISRGPALLNETSALPQSDPPLTNLLIHPLTVQGVVRGQVSLANKPADFTTNDASVVLGVAQLMCKWLDHALPASEPTPAPRGVDYSLLNLAPDLPFALALTNSRGEVLWSNTVFPRLVGRLEVAAPLLPACFTSESAVRLEHLFGSPVSQQRGKLGRLILERPAEAVGAVELLAYWTTAALPEGLGFLFALSPDWEAVCPPDSVMADWLRLLRQPGLSPLPLLIQAGAEVQLWEERWQELTGLSTQEILGTSSELVLDWLFPIQKERDQVADLLHQPPRRGVRQGCQVVLNVLTPTGSRPLLCTFLSIPGPNQDRWLLLASAIEVLAGEDTPTLAHLRYFARGLSHLLKHAVTLPVKFVEAALDHSDLPEELAVQFQQIRDSCQYFTSLIGLLQDLGEITPGELQLTSLAELVREFLDERTAGLGERSYEWKLDVSEPEIQVRVNRRMLKTILDHLLTNAEQALEMSSQKQIVVRVGERAGAACCEIEDTGEGLPTEDWAPLLAPFVSTKGPFARDAAHARLFGTGLGLTVSQHLLTLHGGRLELQNRPGGGALALILLPRAPKAAGEGTQSCEGKRVRVDEPSETSEPHEKPDLSAAQESPEAENR